MAVDISGEPNDARRDIPTPWEAILATILVMGQAITTEKLKHGAPDLIIRPNVGLFRTLDFFQASAILRVCEPCQGGDQAAAGARCLTVDSVKLRDDQRTSQRLGSSSALLLRLIQLVAAK